MPQLRKYLQHRGVSVLKYLVERRPRGYYAAKTLLLLSIHTICKRHRQLIASHPSFFSYIAGFTLPQTLMHPLASIYIHYRTICIIFV